MQNENVEPCLKQAIKIADNWFEYQCFFRRIPGISVGIVYKNKIIFSKGYGFSDLNKKSKVSDTTCYRIASIPKTFTATAIMKLLDQEKLMLDDKVSKYLPWFKSAKDKKLEVITIRELLNHSSGINRDGNTSHWEDDKFPNIKNIKTQVQKGIVVFSPLEKFKYSNLGYTILGEVISIVSGKSYRDFVTDDILKPLKMHNTIPDITTKAKSKLASGYTRDIPNKKRVKFPNPDTQAMSSATGFISNVQDLCKYLSAHFIGSNKLLTDESKRDMQRIQWTRKDQKEHYGLGFEICDNEKIELVGHGGGFQGFITRIAMDKDNKIGVVVLTNAIDGPAINIANGIFEIFKFFKDNKITYRKNSKNKGFNGYDGLFTNRFGEIRLVNINNNLLGFTPMSNSPMAVTYKLKPLRNDKFKITETDDFDYLGETVEFIKNKKGTVVGVKFGPTPMKLTSIKKLSNR